MEKINVVPSNDFVNFNNIVQEYLPGTSERELHKKFNSPNTVFTGYYLDEKLIGVCFGESTDTEHFTLIGIAIIHPHNKQGRGSKLLSYFESIVKSKGNKKISLGSAGDRYVESFYINNGYIVSSLKILTENETWKQKKNDLVPISKIETQGKYTKLVIENLLYDTTDKDNVCEFYAGCDCFYVFEKNIGSTNGD